MGRFLFRAKAGQSLVVLEDLLELAGLVATILVDAVETRSEAARIGKMLQELDAIDRARMVQAMRHAPHLRLRGDLFAGLEITVGKLKVIVPECVLAGAE